MSTINTSGARLQRVSFRPVEVLTSTPPVTRARKIAAGSVELSPRQMAVLVALRTLSRRHRVPATRAETAAYLGLQSDAGIDAHIKTLVARGWAEKLQGSQRGVVLLREGVPLYEPEDLRRRRAPTNLRRDQAPEPAWIDCDLLWEALGGLADLCLWIRDDALDRTGLSAGGIVALSRKLDDKGRANIGDGDIVAARVADEVLLRRARIVDATTCELRPESRSRKHRAVRVNTRADDVELVGVVTGRLLAGAG